MLKKVRKIIGGMTRIQTISLGFMAIILLGSLLLMMPVCSQSGEVTPFLDTLFTSVSATCVTGLVAVDTGQHWTILGKVLILIMIQIGGLGFMTFGIFFLALMRNRIGLKQRALLQESLSTMHVGGTVRLVRLIVKGTALIEGCGAILLSFRFIPRYGWAKGIFFSIFHSISAFCNAGFDLLGGEEEAYCSLVPLNRDPYFLAVIMLLIVIGGLGFTVWNDVLVNRHHFRRYRLHSKIVLTVSAILIFGGGLGFLILENHKLFAGMGVGDKIANALFASVTARTAGFNSVDTGSYSQGSYLLTIILMFIGGGSGSTAGGVKMTTFAVLILQMKSSLMRERGCNVFGRRLADDEIHKAMIVVTINLTLILVGTLLLCGLQPEFSLTDVAFETSSAMGTVGMTVGITRGLGTISRIIILLLMFCGRIGSLSFAFALLEHKKAETIQLPKENIIIG